MSFTRIIVFALALTHVVGLADLVMADVCDEACTDDGCGDDCLPGAACRCHCPSAVPLLTSSGPQAAARLPTPRTTDRFSAAERMHASPDPREILHVPKRAG